MSQAEMERVHAKMDKAEKAFQQTLIDAQGPVITMLSKKFDLSPLSIATVMGKVYIEAGAVSMFAGLGGKTPACADKIALDVLVTAYESCKKHINPEDRL